MSFFPFGIIFWQKNLKIRMVYTHPHPSREQIFLLGFDPTDLPFSLSGQTDVSAAWLGCDGNFS
jgi:hypothetical protein